MSRKSSKLVHVAMRIAFAGVLTLAGAALADRTIVVDGSISDWAGSTSCLTGPFGTSGVVVSQVCMENDNTAGTNGNLYVLVKAANTIPIGTDFYAGFELDTNKNGTLDVNDQVWAAHFPPNSNVASELVLANQNFTVSRVFTPGSCGGPAGSDGWKAVKNGLNVELSMAYGCLALSHCDDSRLTAIGEYDLASGVSNTSTSAYFNGSTDALDALLKIPTTSTPDAQLFTAGATSGKVTLNWNNPQQHEGVVLLHSTGSISASLRLTNGTTYHAGDTVAPGVTVAYADRGSCASTYTDSSVANGTPEYYRLYNHDETLTYAIGNAPSTNGLVTLPTSRNAPAPLSCYSVGFPNLQQPSLQRNTAVFSSGNVGAITATRTSSNAALDGQELWRPLKISGSSQSRSPIVPLQLGSSSYLLTGDQAGHAYVIDASTGLAAWTALLSGPIQAQPGVQLYAYANAAFQAANAPGGVKRDLVFFATRNGASNNEVFALSSLNGAQVWKYSPGNLDIVNGGMLVDYGNNRLYVGAYSNNGTQASLRVLDTLTGKELQALSLGDVDFGINEDFATKQAYVMTRTGLIYGIDLGTMTQVWSYQLPATPVAYPFPTGAGFLVGLKAPSGGGSASVSRYSVGGSPTKVALMWSTNISAVPSGLTVTYGTNSKVYFGTSDSKVHQLNADTGVDEKQVALTPTTGVGMPTIDTLANRLDVGTLDGRLCSFAIPF